MKRNDSLLAASVACYSFLFYKQSPGINFLIFNFVLIACLVLKANSYKPLAISWFLTAFGCLASAFCVGYHDNMLSVISNIISLSLLAGLSIDKKSSVLVSLLTSLCSYFASPVYWVLDAAERTRKTIRNSRNFNRKLFLIGIPVLITLIFFLMYRASNAIFDDLAGKINLDFISIDWIVFTLIGCLLLYGFFFIRKINGLAKWDEKPGILPPREFKTLRLFAKNIPLEDENFSGTVLFVLLNILLLIVNAGDINFLFITHTLPAGINYSQFVHQGINVLIASIIFAIAIVLFYFRGGLNFFEKNKTIKVLAIAWVIQNGFMIFSTACRNARYIYECGLTFKRIGVYVYLTLAVIGLLTTLIKIVKVKSNNFLFRANGWVFYCFLVILSFPDWDKIVTGYNLEHGKIDHEAYLFTLNYSNIPQLLPLYQTLKDTKGGADKYKKYGDYTERGYCMRLYNFLSAHDSLNWKSWYYDEDDTYNTITQSGFTDSITDFDLSNSRDILIKISLKHLSVFKKLTRLNLSQNPLNEINDIASITNLKDLDISYDYSLKYLTEIFKLTNLEKLNLSNTYINNLTGIEKLQKLEDLNLSGNSLYDLSILSNLPNLKTLDLSYCYLDSASRFKGLQNIRKLTLCNNAALDLSGIEALQNLDDLYLASNQLVDYAHPFNYIWLFTLQHLKTLTIYGNGVQDSVLSELRKNLPNTKIIKS